MTRVIRLFTALAARLEGNAGKAHTAFLTAHQALVTMLRDRPNDADVLEPLALADAGLGRKEEALREIRRAVEVRPFSRDAAGGAEFLANLAMVYAWIGARDRAIEELSSVVKLPNGPSFGELKLSPWWDDLRSDPRFAQIVADAAKPISLQ